MTKDPITVLREALEALRPPPSLHAQVDSYREGFEKCRQMAVSIAAAPAAIQPAGGAFDIKYMRATAKALRDEDNMTRAGYWALGHDAADFLEKLADRLPPVPEAKAGQVGAHHLTPDNIAAVIADLRSIEAGTSERASIPEASEIKTWKQRLYEAGPKADHLEDYAQRLVSTKHMLAEISDLRDALARQAAPIAVKGSIGDDAEEVIDLYAGLLEQKMHADRARGFEQSPSYYIKDAIRYTLTGLDARSPVAEAELAEENEALGIENANLRAELEGARDAALEEAAKICDALATGQETYYRGGCLSCARSIRAMSATAASSGEKGEAA